MKTQVVKSDNSNLMRINFGVTKKDLMMVGKMPLSTNPFVLTEKVDTRERTVFSLRFSATDSITDNELCINLSNIEEDAKPVVTVRLPQDDETATKYRVAVYTKRLTAIEKQITDALKDVNETVKDIEVI